MRTTLLATLLLATTLPSAAAHADHGSCENTSPLNAGVHVDVYSDSCAGLAVSQFDIECIVNRDVHANLPLNIRLHVMLDDSHQYQTGQGYVTECQTGVLVAFPGTGEAALLP